MFVLSLEINSKIIISQISEKSKYFFSYLRFLLVI
nr:MAG TPA: hypothetical protein [Caudoviricetes sp.]